MCRCLSWAVSLSNKTTWENTSLEAVPPKSSNSLSLQASGGTANLSRLEFQSQVSRPYAKPPASEVSWHTDPSELEEPEEVPWEVFSAQWLDLCSHMTRDMEVPATKQEELDTTTGNLTNKKRLGPICHSVVPCASKTMQWLSQLNKRAQVPNITQSRNG